MKINGIELNDFRAFAHRESFELGDGKNVLLYGANGAGKSSLFRALKEIFNYAATEPFSGHKNIFTDAARTDGCIRLHFSAPAVAGTPNTPVEWLFPGPRAAGDQRIVQGALRLGALDYRALLDTNYVFKDGTINLFDVLIEGILRPWLVETVNPGGPTRRLRLGTLWTETQNTRIEWPRYRLEHRVRTARAAATIFNSTFNSYRLRLVRRTNAMLRRLGMKQMWITLTYPGIAYDNDERDFTSRTIGLKLWLNRQLITRPQVFLNEARLSALALALYFAALIEVVPQDPTWPRILVLDDVLIGLDMDNRIPVLDIVRNEFRDWQVFLLTHDRTWFELAQIATVGDETWTSFEMHPRPRQENGVVYDVPWVHRPATRPRDVKDIANAHIAKAEAFLALNDDRTAAFHARVAFEAKLKACCHERELPVRYMLDGRRLDTDEFLDAIQAALIREGRHTLVRFQIEKVKLFRRGVLNPYAHYHPVTISPGEVRAALEAVSELNFHNSPIDFVQKTHALLGRAGLTAQELLNASCLLRAAFEVDLRDLLIRLHGAVSFRHDWSELSLVDLWNSATTMMHTTNRTLAIPLIAGIQANQAVFLDNWSFRVASAFTQAQLIGAWNALKDPAAVRTRLSTFT